MYRWFRDRSSYVTLVVVLLGLLVLLALDTARAPARATGSATAPTLAVPSSPSLKAVAGDGLG